MSWNFRKRGGSPSKSGGKRIFLREKIPSRERSHIPFPAGTFESMIFPTSLSVGYVFFLNVSTCEPGYCGACFLRRLIHGTNGSPCLKTNGGWWFRLCKTESFKFPPLKMWPNTKLGVNWAVKVRVREYRVQLHACLVNSLAELFNCISTLPVGTGATSGNAAKRNERKTGIPFLPGSSSLFLTQKVSRNLNLKGSLLVEL